MNPEVEQESGMSRSTSYQEGVRSSKSWLMLRRLIVVVLGIVGWQLVASQVHSRGLSGSPTVPTIQHLLLQSLPRVATFTSQTGSSRFPQGWTAIGPALSVLIVPAFVSSVRVLLGLCAGIAAGIGLGFVVGRVKLAGRLAAPLLQGIRIIPFVVLVPLFTLWFGQSSAGVAAFIAMGVFAVMFTTTVTLVAAIPITFEQYARTLGASRLRVDWSVVLPWLLRRIRGPLSLAVGIAWTLDIAGELLGVQNGLGVLMEDSLRFAYTGRMIVLIVVYVILAITTTTFVSLIVSRLAPSPA